MLNGFVVGNMSHQLEVWQHHHSFTIRIDIPVYFLFQLFFRTPFHECAEFMNKRRVI